MNSGYPEPAEVQLCADCETVKQTGLDYPDHKCPYPVQLWYKFVDQDALAHSVNSPPGTRGKAKGSPPPLSCEPHTSDEPESDTTFTFPLHDDFVITQAAKAANMTVQRNNPLSPCLAPSDDSLLEDSPDLSSGVIDSLQDASVEKPSILGRQYHRHKSTVEMNESRYLNLPSHREPLPVKKENGTDLQDQQPFRSDYKSAESLNGLLDYLRLNDVRLTTTHSISNGEGMDVPCHVKGWFRSDFAISDEQAQILVSAVSTVVKQNETHDLDKLSAVVSPEEVSPSQEVFDIESPRTADPHKFCNHEILLCLLSPVRKLPCEIVYLIFEYCASISQLGSCSGLGPCTAVALSATCSRWRSIALSCSILWADMIVNIPESVTSPSYTRLLEAIPSFATRSATSHRRIQIFSKSENFAACGSRVLSEMFAQAHNWESFRISVPKLASPTIQISAICSSTPGFPSLESLSVTQNLPYVLRNWGGNEDADNEFSQTPLGPSLEIFQSACNLKYLRLRQWAFHRVVPSILDRLSSLTLKDCCMDVFRVLECCVNLRSLLIQFAIRTVLSLGDRMVPQNLNAPIRMTNLRHLYLESVDSIIGQVLLQVYTDNIDLPSLESLDIEVHHDELTELSEFNWHDSSPHSHIRRMIERSNCYPLKLVLTYVRFKDEDLLGLLSVLPKLQELEIKEGSQFPEHVTSQPTCLPISRHFIESLREQGNTTSLRHLRHLSLSIMAHAFDGAHLANIISSRQIATVEICFVNHQLKIGQHQLSLRHGLTYQLLCADDGTLIHQWAHEDVKGADNTRSELNETSEPEELSDHSRRVSTSGISIATEPSNSPSYKLPGTPVLQIGGVGLYQWQPQDKVFLLHGMGSAHIVQTQSFRYELCVSCDKSILLAHPIALNMNPKLIEQSTCLIWNFTTDNVLHSSWALMFGSSAQYERFISRYLACAREILNQEHCANDRTAIL
ncbi:hypothetical protein EV360DRAFT_88601 [Lentinula raphanica]|nr:hypothetical protein EV360DRAFT_88601 [Lentinula raphanica]